MQVQAYNLVKILPALFPVYTLLADLAMRLLRFLGLWMALLRRLCDLLKFFKNTVLNRGALWCKISIIVV